MIFTYIGLCTFENLVYQLTNILLIQYSCSLSHIQTLSLSFSTRFFSSDQLLAQFYNYHRIVVIFIGSVF